MGGGVLIGGRTGASSSSDTSEAPKWPPLGPEATEEQKKEEDASPPLWPPTPQEAQSNPKAWEYVLAAPCYPHPELNINLSHPATPRSSPNTWYAINVSSSHTSQTIDRPTRAHPRPHDEPGKYVRDKRTERHMTMAPSLFMYECKELLKQLGFG